MNLPIWAAAPFWPKELPCNITPYGVISMQQAIERLTRKRIGVALDSTSRPLRRDYLELTGPEYLEKGVTR
jgi:hypothetical protein